MPITLRASIRKWQSTVDGGMILAFDVPRSEKKHVDAITDLEGVVFVTVVAEGEVEDKDEHGG